MNKQWYRVRDKFGVDRKLVGHIGEEVRRTTDRIDGTEVHVEMVGMSRDNGIYYFSPGDLEEIEDPRGWQAIPVDPLTGLTNAETEVYEHLAKAANAFSALPTEHPSETHEFVQAIHRAQDLLAVRIARRHYPEGWPTK